MFCGETWNYNDLRSHCETWDVCQCMHQTEIRDSQIFIYGFQENKHNWNSHIKFVLWWMGLSLTWNWSCRLGGVIESNVQREFLHFSNAIDAQVKEEIDL